MKKMIAILCPFFLSSLTFAQTVDKQAGPAKFNDVVKQHESLYPSAEKDARRKNTSMKQLHEADEKDYQFDRWKWYWQQHLDPNGCIVSPMKTWDEWEKYEQSRKAAKTTSVTLANWSFAGPDSSGADGSGVGRITLVAFHPTNANTYWIGSPGGGAWKTTNNGATWTCMTDNEPLLSISDIKFNPQNPNTVYLCTGDKDADDYFSAGVLKSYNGGTTWLTTGISWSVSSNNLANSLQVNPTDTNTLLLGTTLGIYISHNGGTSWTLAPSTSGVNFKQLLYHPTDTNIVYATSRYDLSTSTSAQIYRSADGGSTWTQITSFTDAYRITLAVTAANVSIVEAVVSSSDFSNYRGLEGIYKSTNAGVSFPLVYSGGCSGFQNLLSFNADGSGCGGQGEYDLTLAISPTNANNVYVGGVNGWRSTNGGVSWSLMDQWSFTSFGVITIHADKHFMGFHPLVPGRFFECNDGGVYWSDNPSPTGVWNDVTNGLGIEEIYRVAVSNLATYELTGAQDVGTKQEQGGLFQDVLGGDGMECQLDPVDTNTAYVSSEFGNIFIASSGGGSNISMNIPGTPTGGWITPFVLEPSCRMCILAGYQDVYLSTDQGMTWMDISGPLTSGDLLRVVTSLSDPSTVYAAEDHSANIFYTNSMGASGWATITAPYSGALISDMKVDQFDATKIWVTFSGYGSQQVASYSPSTGWSPFNTGLPNVPVNCIMIDTSNRVKYLGTDIGVFYRDTTMSSWQPYSHGMPAVRVNDLQINYASDLVWAATYGRSLWSSPRQTFGGPLQIIPLATDYLNVYPNPAKGAFNVILGSNITAKNVTARIVNNSGKTVWLDQVPVNNSNTIQVNISIARGDYILELTDKASIIGRKKLIIY